MPTSYTVHNVTYTYPAARLPALREITFSQEAGEVLVVAGANGAGKSTLLATLAGFAPHFFGGHLEGDVYLNGRSMCHTPLAEWVTSVGLVFANPFNQISGARLTVFEEIAFGLENIGVPPDEIGRRVNTVIHRLSLTELANRSPYTLSGGQQQRVAIASVLVLEPTLLALDEPTSQLDPEGKRDVLTMLHQIAEGGHHMVVMATHDLEATHRLAARGLILHRGYVVGDAPLPMLLARSEWVQWGITPPLEIALAQGTWRPWSAPPPPFESSADELALPESLPVHVERVSYRYPTGPEALRRVSLRVEPGQIVALVGRNGAGKTTLSKMLNGLLRPSEGQVRLGPHDVSDYPVATLARWVGYVFQNPADQIFKRTVWDEVAFGPHNLGFSTKRLWRAVERALALCGLESLAHAHPYDLLPNERRWVTVASALAMETPILVLDEPTGGFDRFDYIRMCHLLRSLRAAGRTILLITHDMGLVAELADRMVIVDSGTVVADAPPRQVLADDELLAKAGLEPPPTVRASRAMGSSRVAYTEEELVALLD
ncbi:MAG: ABC transporter ATP-binding protein [Ardenticatenia bacterium]|nr:ABC transporter ATP-binding protein [Ardenticatenia bacterium]